MTGDHGSKSIFQALIKKTSKEGKTGEALNPQRVEGRATKAMAGRMIKDKPVVIEKKIR